jgi:hypothetical protein
MWGFFYDQGFFYVETIWYWFYMANVEIFTWRFFCGENCHLCRDISLGTFSFIWRESHGGFWGIITGQFSLIFLENACRYPLNIET